MATQKDYQPGGQYYKPPAQQSKVIKGGGIIPESQKVYRKDLPTDSKLPTGTITRKSGEIVLPRGYTWTKSTVTQQTEPQTTTTTQQAPQTFNPQATVKYGGITTSAQAAVLQAAQELQLKKITAEEYNRRIQDIANQSKLAGATATRQAQVSTLYTQVTPQQATLTTAKTLETNKKVMGQPINVGYTQGKQVAQAIASIPKQIAEGTVETLVTQPYAFGKSVREESKGNILAVPGVVGRKIVGAAATVVTQPQLVFTGVVGAALTKPVKFGTQVGLNLLAFKGAGYAAEKIYGKVTTFGKTYIPQEKLVVPEVRAEIKAFPEVKNAAQALQKFNQEAYKSATGRDVVYSASDYPFTPFLQRNITVTSGRGLIKPVDVPGIYTSTRGVSAYFLRLKQGLTEYKLFPSSVKELLPRQPKILAVAATPQRIPSSYLTSLEKAQSYFGKTTETIKLAKAGAKNVDKVVARLTKGTPGVPYISPALEFGLKQEAEAVIQVGSKLKRVGMTTGWEKLTGFSKYTKISGTTLPIYELESVGKGLGVKGLTSGVSAGEYASYSSGVVSKSVISPSTLGATYLSIPPSKTITSSVKVPSSSSVYSPKLSSIKFASVSSKSIPSYTSSSIYTPEKVSSTRVSSRAKSIIKPTPSYVPSVPSYVVPSKKYVVSTPTLKKSIYIPELTSPKYYPKEPEFKQEFPVIKKKKVEVRGFSVFTRVKGKKIRLASRVPFNLATYIGRGFTAGTTARSFVVAPEGFTTRLDVPSVNLSQYRSPKIGGNVEREGFKFVEKSKFAIDTIGEKKGLLAGRKRKGL